MPREPFWLGEQEAKGSDPDEVIRQDLLKEGYIALQLGSGPDVYQASYFVLGLFAIHHATPFIDAGLLT